MANEKKALEIRVVKDVKEDAPERSGFQGQADIAWRQARRQSQLGFRHGRLPCDTEWWWR